MLKNIIRPYSDIMLPTSIRILVGRGSSALSPSKMLTSLGSKNQDKASPMKNAIIRTIAGYIIAERICDLKTRSFCCCLATSSRFSLKRPLCSPLFTRLNVLVPGNATFAE
jgi:hypothetical protein